MGLHCSNAGMKGRNINRHNKVVEMFCTNAGMKGRNINRHNKLVEMFAKTLKRGKKGGLRITYDAGRLGRRKIQPGGLKRWMQSCWCWMAGVSKGDTGCRSLCLFSCQKTLTPSGKKSER